MRITIQIKDKTKVDDFLNYINSLDYVSICDKEKDLNYPSLTEEEIVNRVSITNEQIVKGQTISQKDLEEDSKNW